MKKSLHLLVVFIGIASCKPHELMKVNLEDKSEIMVKGKFKGEYLLYGNSKEKDLKKIHYSEIEYVEKPNYSDDLTKFKYFKIANGSKYLLLEEKIVGSVSLYTKTFQGGGAVMPATQSMHVGSGMGMTFATTTPFPYVESYVKKDSNEKAVFLSSNKILQQVGPAFFKDCPEIVRKIKSKEYTKKHVEEMVNFYNANCSTNEQFVKKKYVSPLCISEDVNFNVIDI